MSDARGRVFVGLPRRAPPASDRPRRILVLGPPNTGKTTLFNRLAGTNLRVGNYPGVTVEGTTARVQLPDIGPIDLVDLPGTYSLSGRGGEERIAVDALLGRHGHAAPDAVLVLADATHLENHLYLALQVVELGVPTLVVLNMADEAAAQGVDIDVAALSQRLGTPVVAASARTGQAVDELLPRAAGLSRREDATPPPVDYPPEVLAAADAFPAPSRAHALWALLSVEPGADDESEDAAIVDAVAAARAALEGDGVDVDAAIVGARYAFIDRELMPCVTRREGGGRSLTDRIDAVLVHPAWGFVLFLAIMTLLFQGLFSWSDPAIGLVEAAIGALADGARAVLPPGVLEDFVADGLIAGVGSVLVFLPQILLLFLLIGVMEDSGYMARIAYLMDRIMKSVGLHGRAFVPMLSGFACAVPAVLATRTMERKRDRFLTMMVVPLTLCSARLPVYTLLIAALYPAGDQGRLPVQGLLLAGMYVFSIGVALIAAAVLGRTVLKGRKEPLLLELPPYRLPRLATVLRMMWDRTRIFLTEAGTVILLCTVILWALLAFPRMSPEREADLGPEEAAAVSLQESYGGRLGKAIEPVIAPLGFDWKIGVGLIGAFAAREVFVATMGVVYGVGGDVDENSATLRQRIRAESRADGRPVYTPLVGFSLMIFFALACQCMSTLAAVKRETRSWRWPAFLFVYMTALAWICSFAVYQGGRALGFG